MRQLIISNAITAIISGIIAWIVIQPKEVFTFLSKPVINEKKIDTIRKDMRNIQQSILYFETKQASSDKVMIINDKLTIMNDKMDMFSNKLECMMKDQAEITGFIKAMYKYSMVHKQDTILPAYANRERESNGGIAISLR